MDPMILLLVGLIVTILIIVIILLIHISNSRLKESFLRENERNLTEQRQFNTTILQLIGDLKSTFSNDLMGFNHQLNDDFNSLSERTLNKMSVLERNLNENISDAYKQNNETFENIRERLMKIDAAQKNIEDLSRNISSLESILSDKKSRGTFGEIELYSLLESAMGEPGTLWKKQVHYESGVIADAVIFGNSALNSICIDSKFPLENYRRIFEENISGEEVLKRKKLFTSDVIKHINAIADKYIIEGITADFACMFLPSEAVYSYINANLSDVVDYSYKKKVYMVSPSTLMAYITAIKALYLGQKRDEKAKVILQELNDLAEDFRRLSERNEKMNNALETFMENYRLFEISRNKITKKFDSINHGELNEK